MAERKKKTEQAPPPRNFPDTRQIIAAIEAIARAEYGGIAPRLASLFRDVTDLYAGRWPSHEACEVTYHSIEHALDVALAVARMIAGWNSIESARPFLERHFHLGLAAALFHDAGYIKEKGDHEGLGGKFTLVHVARGMEIARNYLRRHEWSEEEAETVAACISVTDYSAVVDVDSLFNDPSLAILARMVATADLVAQMADSKYIQRMDDLFAEFKEVYEFEETEALLKKGARVYRTAQEIKDGTISFYEHFVVPTLHRLGRMDRYLTNFFADGRNPYQENITANLSSHLMDISSQWRRIGDILEELGLASPEQVRLALSRQEQLTALKRHGAQDALRLEEMLRTWFTGGSRKGTCLGDILMEMEAVSPQSLAKGLLAQMLPDSFYESLSARELHFLLRTAILLQNVCKGPWILGVVMEMTNEVLDCEASTILIADSGGKEMLVTLPTGTKKNQIYGRKIPVDKGLAGWVYRNGKPAMVGNAERDARFDRAVDREIGFVTRSILAVPFFMNGQCLGVLEALNKGNDRFTRHDMHVLSILSSMLANVMAGVFCAQSAR